MFSSSLVVLCLVLLHSVNSASIAKRADLHASAKEHVKESSFTDLLDANVLSPSQPHRGLIGADIFPTPPSQFGPNGPPFGPNGPPFGPNGPPFGPNGPPFGPNGPPFGPNGPPFDPSNCPGGDPNHCTGFLPPSPCGNNPGCNGGNVPPPCGFPGCGGGGGGGFPAPPCGSPGCGGGGGGGVFGLDASASSRTRIAGAWRNLKEAKKGGQSS